jgi:hypothetical protein
VYCRVPLVGMIQCIAEYHWWVVYSVLYLRYQTARYFHIRSQLVPGNLRTIRMTLGVLSLFANLSSTSYTRCLNLFLLSSVAYGDTSAVWRHISRISDILVKIRQLGRNPIGVGRGRLCACEVPGAQEFLHYRSFPCGQHLDQVIKEGLAFDRYIWEVTSAFVFRTLKGSHRYPECCALPNKP